MPKSLPPDEIWAKSAYDEDLGANGAAAQIIITPAPGERVVLDWFVVSWNTAPVVTQPTTLSIDGTDVFTYYPYDELSIQGKQFFGPWTGGVDEVIQLDAPGIGAGDDVALCCKYRKTATIT